jgi:hypothetical protein
MIFFWVRVDFFGVHFTPTVTFDSHEGQNKTYLCRTAIEKEQLQQNDWLKSIERTGQQHQRVKYK